MAFAVMIGICILPALYAWFNIAANWDPYSNTGNIKIAVANCDNGTKLASKEINIGNQIVDNLKKKRKRPPATIVPVYPTPNSVKKAN